MATVSDAVRAVVDGSPMLQVGLHHRLLNLSQVARFIRPLVEARVRKPAKASAILMGLSRLQRAMEDASFWDAPPSEVGPFYIDRIGVHTGLASVTLTKTSEAHQELSRLMGRVQEEGGYLTVTEGNTEITALLEDRRLPLVQETLSSAPKKVQRHLAGLGVQFHAAYTEKPGLLYHLLQQLSLQQINVVEVTSTLTEFNIYLHEDRLMLAFDSLYHRFSREHARPDPLAPQR